MQILKLVNEIAMAHFETDAGVPPSDAPNIGPIAYRSDSASENEIYEDLCKRAGIDSEEIDPQFLEFLWALVVEAYEALVADTRAVKPESNFCHYDAKGLNMSGLADTVATRRLIRRWCDLNAKRKGCDVDESIDRFNIKMTVERADLLVVMAKAQLGIPRPGAR